MKEVFYDWGGVNAWLFHVINGIYSPIWGRLMVTLSDLGEHRHMRYYLPVIALILIIRLFVRKARGWKIERKDVRTEFALIVLLVMGYAAYGFIIGLIKTMVAFPRPFMVFPQGTMAFWLSAYPEAAEYYTSFPSGHAATMGFLVAALWHRLPNYARYFGLGLMVAVCISRVAIGMHFPADVVGGALIGAGVAYFVRRYVYRMLKVEYRVRTDKLR